MVSSFFGPNPYALAARDPAYARRLAFATGAPMGNPAYRSQQGYMPDFTVFNSYDKAGDSGGQGEQLAATMQKIANFRAMSPEEQRHAMATGIGYPTNTEVGNALQIMNNMPQGAQEQYQQMFRDRLDKTHSIILNDPGYGGNMKSWAALGQGNKTWSAVSADSPHFRTMEGITNQLGNQARQLQEMGINVHPDMLRRADTRDYVTDFFEPYGGWKTFGMGYNSMGMGGGAGAPTAAFYDGDNFDAGNAWGSGEGYRRFDQGLIGETGGWGSGLGAAAGWAPSGSSFRNNSLLGSDWDGVTAYAPRTPGPGVPGGFQAEPRLDDDGSRMTYYRTVGGGQQAAPWAWGYRPPGSQTGGEATAGDIPGFRNQPNPNDDSGYLRGNWDYQVPPGGVSEDQAREIFRSYPPDVQDLYPELKQKYGEQQPSGYHFPDMEFNNYGGGAGTFEDAAWLAQQGLYGPAAQTAWGGVQQAAQGIGGYLSDTALNVADWVNAHRGEIDDWYRVIDNVQNTINPMSEFMPSDVATHTGWDFYNSPYGQYYQQQMTAPSGYGQFLIGGPFNANYSLFQ